VKLFVYVAFVAGTRYRAELHERGIETNTGLTRERIEVANAGTGNAPAASMLVGGGIVSNQVVVFFPTENGLGGGVFSHRDIGNTLPR